MNVIGQGATAGRGIREDDGSRPASVTSVWGAFAARTAYADLPAALVHEGRRSLLNSIGCALGVARSAPVEQAVAVLGQFAGPAQATLIGRTERLDMLSASFVNAVGSNLLDYDDTHLATVIHPTAPVAPPVLALAETRGLSGAEVLLAFILGAEIECRLGQGVSPGHYARGWHITATCGVFGAAAASAKLLGLSEARTAHALGIAASQSAGLVENLPSAAKNVGVGNAARNGLFAALMAQAGYEASPGAVEGPLGWARACGDDPDILAMVDGLGSRWEMLRNTYKPYPSGIVFHAVVDACLALRRDHPIDADAVETVVVSGDALLLARGDRPVHTERDARVSIHHSAAVVFVLGRAGLAEYGREAVADARIAAFRAKVRAELDASLPRGAARVVVNLVDGSRHEATVLHPQGSAEHPMSDAEIEAKVRDLARHGGADCDIEAVIGAVWQLGAATRASDLLALTRPAAS